MFRFATFFVLVLLCGCNSQPPTDIGDNSGPALAATVVSYEQNAEWDHFDDGSFATYDHLILKLDSDESFSVAVSPDTLPDESPFRVSGTRFTFTLSEPFSARTHLAWGAINDPTIIE